MQAALLLKERAIHTAPSSRALPGWKADEIHRTLNEPDLSVTTTAALRPVGRALGAADGTGPDDNPFLRTVRLEGRAEAQRAEVLQVFSARGLAQSAALPPRLAEPESVSTVLVEAALECRDEADFLRRLTNSPVSPPKPSRLMAGYVRHHSMRFYGRYA